MTFDPKMKLVMAKFRTVHGHNLNRGAKLTIVDEPASAGEVTLDMARRLHAGRIAVEESDFRPTPVETKEQEAARLLAGEPASPTMPSSEVDGDLAEVPPDLTEWQKDDEELGRKQGDRVTADDLRMIASREEIDLAGAGRSRSDLQLRIMETRASRAVTDG